MRLPARTESGRPRWALNACHLSGRIGTRLVARKLQKRYFGVFPHVQLSGYLRQLLTLNKKPFLPLSLQRHAAETRIPFPHRPDISIRPDLQLSCSNAGNTPDSVVIALKLELEKMTIRATAIFLGAKVFCTVKWLANLARNVCPNFTSAYDGGRVCENGFCVSEPGENGHVNHLAVERIGELV